MATHVFSDTATADHIGMTTSTQFMVSFYLRYTVIHRRTPHTITFYSTNSTELVFTWGHLSPWDGKGGGDIAYGGCDIH